MKPYLSSTEIYTIRELCDYWSDATEVRAYEMFPARNNIDNAYRRALSRLANKGYLECDDLDSSAYRPNWSLLRAAYQPL